METKYNGYTNRSTWLAKLHLDNTNLEVSKMANEIGIEADTTRQFKNMILPVLRIMTRVSEEQNYDPLQINFSELWDCYRFSK